MVLCLLSRDSHGDWTKLNHEETVRSPFLPETVFDMYMSIRVHVRSWSTAPLISGFKVSNQIVFGMGSLGSIPSYRASEI